MSIKIVRLGSKRAAQEGLRIGTVRRPPRGVAKKDFAKKDYYDVWLPILSPSVPLMKKALKAKDEDDKKEWVQFVRHFKVQMKESDAAKNLDLLAALSHQTNFSIGCYCEDEKKCHRSILRKLLEERGANIRE